jgi:hypothetical protein
MAKMDKISWPLVVLAAVTLGTVVILANMGLEIAAIGTVVASLLAILITQQVSTKENLTEVKTNTNGNNQRLVDAILNREIERDKRESTRDKLMYEMLLALPPGTRLPALEAAPYDSDGDVQSQVDR